MHLRVIYAIKTYLLT